VLARDRDGLVTTVPAVVWGERGFQEERGARQLWAMCGRERRRLGSGTADRPQGPVPDPGIPAWAGAGLGTAHEGD
jgi:pilus assembly protein CpaF